MINDIISFGASGLLELLIVFVIAGIYVFIIVLFLRLLLRSKKENIRLRLEVGKLADELEQVRKQAKGGQNNNSSTESG